MAENNIASSTVIEIDLTYIMSEVEEIVKKYISIDDLEYCFFAPTKRYPLDKTMLHRYNKKIIRNSPYLPLLCSGIIIDIIKFSIYRNNFLSKHFFTNSLITDEEYRIKNCTDDETFKISDREFKTIEDIINYHIDNTVKWKRDGALLALTREYKNVYKDKLKITHKEIFKQHNLKYLEEFEDDKLKISDNFQNDDLDNLYDKLNKILSIVDNLNLPMDRIIEIDDEGVIHKIYIREHILERRYTEAGIL